MPDSSSSVKCASALSTHTDIDTALHEVYDNATTQLGGPADLAVVFFSADHRDQAEKIATQLCQRLDTVNLIGCTGESIVGTKVEAEMQPALSLFLARLPDVQLELFQLGFERGLSEPGRPAGEIIGWPDGLPETLTPDDSLLVLGEPFSFPADLLLSQLNSLNPPTLAVGGMASGGQSPGSNLLLLGPRVLDSGAVVARIRGAVHLHSITSQGCRPIGSHFVITKCEQNVIQELGGVSAMKRLEEVFSQLPTSDQRLVNNGLHVGRVMNEYQDSFEQGDFLVKNVIGADPNSGVIAISDYVRVGQTVQFHVRDEASADAELKALLAGKKTATSGEIAGGLLFTCNGRGTRLFSLPHHDASAINDAFTDLPLAGFFAQGEIGPVGNQNYIHGFTASVALFESPTSG